MRGEMVRTLIVALALATLAATAVNAQTKKDLRLPHVRRGASSMSPLVIPANIPADYVAANCAGADGQPRGLHGAISCD